ncbi:alpha-glucosidase C-terminal domain-containing protein [Hungatella hathewayi]
MSFYRELIVLRKSYEIIIEGDYNLLYPEDDNVYAYTREWQNQKILVICNFSKEHIAFQFPSSFDNKENRLLIGNYEGAALEKEMLLRPYEADVFLFTS